MKQSDLERLAQAALALPDKKRRAFIESAVASEPDLVARVLAMISREPAADVAPETVAFHEAATAHNPVAVSLPNTDEQPAAIEGHGTWVGRYRMIEELGEGGMGSVWRAEQHDPVQREVALKVIKLGMDTKEVIARFEAERQALAMMDHPHIARVFDGGATDAGRPFFVMELVQGPPITDYCEEAGLGLRERLELFTQVCQAVQHAHQKGIIHRDLKPSNVLVTVQDGIAMPKVIDFGIAKATNAELTQRTLFTQEAQIIGTPEYMAPEQADPGGLDIDTRADVYALGVLLYELLTGTKPFDMQDVLAAGYQELLRTIREVEPAKPSTRVSTLGVEPSSSATHRAIEPQTLSRRLRGDLDWIVMTALEKERDRRYATASGFADDISRYLANEPVTAAPPSAYYRLRKLVRRHRGRVIAGALLGVTLLAGLTGTGLGLLWALDEREVAREAQSDALRELDRAREVKRLIADMIGGVDPVRARELDTTLLEGILADAAKRLFDGEIADPLIRAELHALLSEAYFSIGNVDEQARHAPMAYELYAEHLGADAFVTLRAQTTLADMLGRQRRVEESLATYDAAITGFRSRRAKQPINARDPELDMDLARALNNVSRYLYEQERDAEAEAALREAIALQSAAVPVPEERGGIDPATAAYQRNLSLGLLRTGRPEEAEKLQLAVRGATAKFYDKQHPMALAALFQLGQFYLEAERPEEAERYFAEALAEQEKILPPGHTDLIATRMRLAHAYKLNGHNEQAQEQYLALATVDTLKDERINEGSLNAMGLSALALFESGKQEESIRLFDKTLALCVNALGERSAVTTRVRNNLIAVLARMDRHAELAVQRRRAYELLVEQHSETDERAIKMQQELGYSLLRQGDYPQAIEVLQQVVARVTDTGKQDLESSLGARTNLGIALLRSGQHLEAVTVLEASVAAKRRVLGLDHSFTHSAISNLAAAYRQLGRTDDADTIDSELLEHRLAKLVHPNATAVDLATAAKTLLVAAAPSLQDPERALALVDRALTTGQVTDLVTAFLRDVRARALFRLDRLDDALQESRRAVELLPENAPENYRREFEANLQRFEAAAADSGSGKEND